MTPLPPRSARKEGVRSGAGAPINVAGTLWGVITVASSREEGLPAGVEARLADFTELLATAIANAEAREKLSRVADEQAALRRVATLVAQGALPPEVFAAVTDEVGHLLGTEVTWLRRYLPGPAAALVAAFAAGERLPSRGAEGAREPEARPSCMRRGVRRGCMAQTGCSTIRRACRYRSHPASACLSWLKGACGGPCPWPRPAMRRCRPVPKNASPPSPSWSPRRSPTWRRTTSWPPAGLRVVASADETRRRIERDLHDGAQQRLLSLTLQLQAIGASVPPEEVTLAEGLDRVSAGFLQALDELRELARGIHPAILAETGLGPALRALARRSAVPVELDLRVEDRFPERVEVTVYYVVSEALTNAAKHASATVVHVDLDAKGTTWSGSPSATTGSGAPTRCAALACSGCVTASRQPVGGSPSTVRSARAQNSSSSSPCDPHGRRTDSRSHRGAHQHGRVVAPGGRGSRSIPGWVETRRPGVLTVSATFLPVWPVQWLTSTRSFRQDHTCYPEELGRC